MDHYRLAVDPAMTAFAIAIAAAIVTAGAIVAFAALVVSGRIADAEDETGPTLSKAERVDLVLAGVTLAIGAASVSVAALS